MSKRDAVRDVIIYGVFFFYLLLLVQILLFSRVQIFLGYDGQTNLYRSINIIPFHSIMQCFAASPTVAFAYGNAIGNLLLFFPLGTYLTVLKKDKRTPIILMILFIASFSVEVIQGLFGLGTADIDDVILNCLGGLFGVFVYKLLSLILHDERKIRTVIAVLSGMGFPVVFYLLFIMKMRF